MALTLKNLLGLYGLTDFAATKIVRHKDARLELFSKMGMFELLERQVEGKPLIEWYQSTQSADVFRACKRIVSFYVNHQNLTVLLGVFDCRGYIAEPLPDGLPHALFYENANFQYQLDR